MIRPASKLDIDRIMEHMPGYWDIMTFFPWSKFNESATRETFLNVVDSDTADILIHETGDEISGFIGCTVNTAFFYAPDLAVDEFIWWVPEKHRGRDIGRELVGALEVWGKSKGAKSSYMSVTLIDEDTTAEDLLLNAGYSTVEKKYHKVLEDPHGH